MSDITVRAATRADAAGLRAIRLEALTDEPDAYGSTFEEMRDLPLAHWEDQAVNRPIFLAFGGGRVIGMASGGPNDEFPDTLFLYGMFVTPAWRGSGVAAALVRRVASWARDQGARRLGLHVTTSLPRPVAFYTKMGFVPVGTPHPMGRDHRLLLQAMTTDLTTNDRI